MLDLRAVFNYDHKLIAVWNALSDWHNVTVADIHSFTCFVLLILINGTLLNKML